MPRGSNQGKCPLCKQGAHQDFSPFCSRSCRDRDLLNWFGDQYRLPGEQVNLENENALGHDESDKD